MLVYSEARRSFQFVWATWNVVAADCPCSSIHLRTAIQLVYVAEPCPRTASPAGSIAVGPLLLAAVETFAERSFDAHQRYVNRARIADSSDQRYWLP